MPSGDRCACLDDALAAAVGARDNGRVEVVGSEDGLSITDVERIVDDVVAAEVLRLVFVTPAPLPAHLGGTLGQAGTVGLLSAAARNAAVRLAPRGTANVVVFGPLAVDRRCGAACAGVAEEVRAQVETAAITQRLSTPTEVAEAVAFLLSDAASYVNGIVVPVDGGLSVGRYA